MTTRHKTRLRARTLLQRAQRFIRYKLIVPVFRSRKPPEVTARGVSNGVFWGLTPTLGFQTFAIVGTWVAGRRILGKDSSLLQGLIWAWVMNPITIVPMYYTFYVTGLWLTGTSGPIGGYDTFVRMWEETQNLSWTQSAITLARRIGVPTVIGCIPYAVLGSWISYRWALKVVERRRIAIDAARSASHAR